MPIYDYVRVRDKDTGHEYDVVVSAVDPAAHEVLKDYPANDTGQPRPAKHRTDKAAKPATTTARPKHRAAKKATTPAANTTKKE